MAKYFRRKKAFEFTDKDIDQVNYKNLKLLKECVMESGRIVPSRVTGTSAKFQRRVAHAVKVARFLALLPYCDMHDK